VATSQKNSAPTADPLIGTRLGDYEIRRLIGRGGMARVYEGFDANLHRSAAIKVINPQSEDSDEMKQRFFREARAVANLHHPNIVTVYQFGQGEGLYYLAMRLLEGQTLLQKLKRLRTQKRLIETDQLLSVVDDVSAALDYAHRNGVIHRDIKPSNVMLSNDKHAILMDFGLLMETSGDNTLGTAFGTPRYIAPEQAVASDRAVPQSDIYSLGVIVYEMVTGQTPFDADSAMSLALLHISTPPPPPRSLRPDLSEAVEQVILKALEKRPEARWQTARQFATALHEAFSGKPQNIKLSGDVLAASEIAAADPSPTPLLSGSQMARPASLPKPLIPTVSEDPTNPSRSVHTARLAKKRASRLQVLAFTVLAALIVGVGALMSYLLTPQATPPLLPAPNGQFALPAVRFVYSNNAFVIYNISRQTLPLGELRFEQGNRTANFPSNTTLLPEQCAVIRVTSNAALPENCANPDQKVDLRRGEAPFWTPSAGIDVFRVLRAGQTLATCSTRLNGCEIVGEIVAP
jgi:serine/threonine-protein kinase